MTKRAREMGTATAMTGAAALSVSLYDLLGAGPETGRYAAAALGLLVGLATALSASRAPR
jgi:hypothetical protein